MDISSRLSDEEILKKISNKEIKLRSLSSLGEKRAASLRLKYLEKALGIQLSNISLSVIDPEKSKANIENMIGGAQLPIGIAGPVKIKGEYVKGEYHLPLATTEGALVASVNRGCSAINKAGGCSTIILSSSQTRSVLFRADTLEKVKGFLGWLENNKQELKKIGDSTDRFIKIQDIEPHVLGYNLWLRVKADTEDAMGMNMVTVASKKIADRVASEFDIEFVSESGNMCVDKKPSSMNLINSRGKKIIASVNIHEDVIRNVLKTEPKKIADMNYRKNLLGSAASGSLGFNAHFANIVAAFYIATGQDPAHVVSGSMGFTTAEVVGKELQVTVTLPSVQVATVGGGTSLPTQKEAISITRAKSSKELGEILAAAVLAGEISLLGALCSKDLAGAHLKHNR